MNKKLQLRNSGLTSKLHMLLMLALFMMIYSMTNGQVSFTQTTDADFYQGAYNDLIISGNSISLPNQATDVTTWLTTTVLPQTLAGHKVATWNNRYVYLVGGYNDVSYSSAVYRATLNSTGISSWTSLGSLPTGLGDHAVVIGTNAIYVLGGRDASSIFNTIYYAEINTDGSLGDWETASVALPASLWGHTAVYSNGYIYVAGGSNTSSSTAALNNVYVAKVLADNSLSTFAATTNLPQARNGHTMLTFGDKVYVVAGFANGGIKTNTIYFASTGNGGGLSSWSTATALPVSISNHSSVIQNGLITVLAGETGGSPSNKVYFADIHTSPLAWNLATNVLYDYTKDGAAFSTDGWIGYCGGENLSGTPIHNSRYANLSLSTEYCKNGFFVSNPFYELGAERFITELSFTTSIPAVSSSQVAFRTAGEDLDWGNWTGVSAISPLSVGVTDRYLQYKVVLGGNGIVTPIFSEMNLWTPGTELSGNLNAISTFDIASSPYWVTGDISFTSGSHTFDAGVELNFLPQTGMTVGQANVVCNGTVSDSVVFRGFTSETGTWDGIYFDPNSNNGVSSQFYYTVIQGAGYGSWNANLYCNSTDEPLLMHCSLRGADGVGLSLSNAHLTIEETYFGGNTHSGIYFDNSNPSFINCETSDNQFAGLYLTSVASEPNFYGMLSENNLYAMYYPSPDFTILPPNGTSLTFTGNTYNGICIEAGRVNNNQTWNSISYDYILLGDLVIGKAGSNSRLTIEPGNTVKFVPGSGLQVGTYIPYSHYGGELYAIGTADSLITFTSWDGTVGGWEGIYFDDNSDYYGGSSVMDYCVVENGNDYNIYCYNTNQALVMNTAIRDAVLDGVKLYNSYGTFQNCDFSGFGRYPIYFEDWRPQPVLTNNTFSSKGINLIGHAGGHFTEDKTLQNDGIGYHILNSITVGKAGSNCRLTIDPGLNVNFEPGTGIQVGIYIPYSHYGGELNAVGSVGNEITFKPYNNLSGGWEGIYYEDNSDYYSGVSTLDYCIIEKGNEYNLYSENTTQPGIDHSIFRDAVQYGIKEYQASPQIHNSQFLNNGSYPVYYTDWSCNSHLHGNIYAGNTPDKFALSGGHYTDGRTLYNDGIDYLVLSNITIGKSGSACRLTIEPGNTLRFDSGTQLQIGTYIPYSNYGGELWAEGNADSVITFMPDSEIAGDWEGIFFDNRSDYSGAVSSMKHCVVEDADQYNIYCESTTQPATFEHNELTGSLGDGLKLYNSTIGNLINSDFVDNLGHGIYFDGTSQTVIGNDAENTCNIFGNGNYGVYNNTSLDIEARYNYWGTADSAMIAALIFDYYDLIAKGVVIFGDFAQLPALGTSTTQLSGNVWYHNQDQTDLTNAVMDIYDFSGTPIVSTLTNGSGYYSFPSFTSGNYTMEITPAEAWGGVNSTDALLILNHFAHVDTLTGMPLAAADVNFSQTVNGTDAMFVMQRYATIISSFPAGDWFYNTENLLINGTQVTNDLSMLCFGDVNESYLNSTKDDESVFITYDETMIINSFTNFDLKINIKDIVSSGAISLGIGFPEDLIQVNDIEFPYNPSGAIINVENGMLRLAWAGLEPLELNPELPLLILHCEAGDLSAMQQPIQISIAENSEFANQDASVFESVQLSTAELTTLAVGVYENGLNNLSCSNSPNPCNVSTLFNISVPEKGEVSVIATDLAGQNAINLLDQSVDAGHQQFEIHTTDLKPGVYLYRMIFKGETITGTTEGKLVVTR